MDEEWLERIRGWMPILYQESSYDKYQAKIAKHQRVNRVLVYVVGGLAAFLLIYGIGLAIRYGRFDLNRFEPATSTRSVGPIRGESTPRAIDMAVFNRRDIFQPAGTAGTTSRSELKKLAQFKQAIRVVGITFDREYQAIVENIFTKETIFVQTGDEVMGARVSEIMDDRVIFEMDQEKIEIQP